MNRPDLNARMDAGLTAAATNDEAALWDTASQDAFDQALDLVEQPGSDATSFALLGVGLALRAVSVRLEGLAEQLFDLVDARTEPERSADEDETTTPTPAKDADEPADQAEGPVAGVAHVIPLQRVESRAARSRTARS